MRYLMMMLVFLSGAVCAQGSSFEREFSKFDKDFERLNQWKAETPASKKIKKQEVVQPVTPSDKAEVQPLDPVQEPEKPLKDPTTKIEPLSHSDLLGPQIKDPVVRKQVQDLYKRPDVVVQQYILPTN
jgi:hypothetical protein